jgi:DNA-binding transcriptional regulator YdaS (Cro superfamily)
MTLLEYAEQFGVKFTWIATKCGVSPNTISAYAHTRTRPNWEMAGLIEQLTQGHVERAQWYPPDASKPQKTAGASTESVASHSRAISEIFPEL